MTNREKTRRQLQRYQNDFPLFAREQLYIITKEAKLSPFKLNRAQMKVWTDEIEPRLNAGLPIRMYILKARQLGFSTLIQGIGFWRCALRKYQNALTISHEIDSAEEIFKKSVVFYQHMDKKYRPHRQRSNRREVLFAKDLPNQPEKRGLQSQIAVATAKNKHLGASRTMSFLHCSEFARWEEVNNRVRVAWPTLMQTVPNVAGTFVFLETTAWGVNLAKEIWDAEANGFAKVFVSWCADDSYRHDTPMDMAELEERPDSRFGDERTVYRSVIDQLVYWYPERADDPQWLTNEALCRMHWRRLKVAHDFNYELKLFQQEYPITPEEAFLFSGSNVFDTRLVADYMHALSITDGDRPQYDSAGVLKLRYPYKTFRHIPGVVGDDDRSIIEAPHGNIRVYDEPVPGGVYVIGGDVGEGVTDGDMSAAHVLKLPELKQVAVFEDLTEPFEFADLLFALGRWYNWAGLCVEVNGPGIATNQRLAQQLFYPDLYYRQDFDAEGKKFVRKYGWHTNTKTKPIVISTLRKWMKDKSVLWRDVPTLEQMLYYVEKDGKMGASSGKHDDLVMSVALTLQMAAQRNWGTAQAAENTDRVPGPGTVGYEMTQAENQHYHRT